MPPWRLRSGYRRIVIASAAKQSRSGKLLRKRLWIASSPLAQFLAMTRPLKPRHRKARGEGAGARCKLLFRRAVALCSKRARDDRANLAHLGKPHAARGGRGRSEPQAGGPHGRVRIIRYHLLVGGEAHTVKRLLRHRTVDIEARNRVDDEEVIIRAARHKRYARAGEGRGKRLRIGEHLFRIDAEGGQGGKAEGDGGSSHLVHMRP